MTAIQTSLLPNRTIDEFVEDIKLLTQEVQKLYCLDEIPWIIGVSWGKDSLFNTLLWRDTLDISTNLVGRWTAGEQFTKSLQKANFQILKILEQKLSQKPNSN